MNILHICLFSHFTAGMTYQENCLTEQNLRDGHTVSCITDTACYRDGKLVQVPESDEVLPNGLRLLRVAFDPVLGKGRLSYRAAKVKKLQTLLPQLAPDVILYHGFDGCSLLYAARYAQRTPGVRLYVDSHADFNNTAQNLKSVLWHKCFTRPIVRRTLPAVEKVFYISWECREFLLRMYGVPEERLAELLLGGTIAAPQQQAQARQALLKDLGWPGDAVILAHSGRLTAGKKTKDLLLACKQIGDPRLRLLLFGSIPGEEQAELEPLIKADGRVRFLGWKTGSEIEALLQAADVYVLPGSESATVQVAACCGCAEVVQDCESYRYVFGDAALFVDADGSLTDCIARLVTDTAGLARRKAAAYAVAREKLDYRVIAQKYLGGPGR